MTTKRKTKPAVKFRDVRLCTDEDGNEAIYVNGRLRFVCDTAYQHEVAEQCGTGLVKIKHHSVKSFDGDWPEKFAELVVEE